MSDKSLSVTGIAEECAKLHAERTKREILNLLSPLCDLIYADPRKGEDIRAILWENGRERAGARARQEKKSAKKTS